MENEFYILDNAFDTKETGGVFPQSEGMTKNYDYTNPKNCWNLKVDSFPDFTPDLNAFRIEEDAKLTDAISINSINFGFLFNEKIKNIISKYNIPENRFFTSYISYKNSIRNSYYFFYFIHNYAQFLDYKKTNFYLADSFGDIKSININDAEEYNNYYQIHNLSTLYSIKTDKYIFINNHLPTYDMFKISKVDNNTYISHRLKTALEEANVTGIEIVPTDVL